MTEPTLQRIADAQAALLEKLKDLPVTDEAGVLLDLFDIQTLIAYVLANHIIKGKEVS